MKLFRKSMMVLSLLMMTFTMSACSNDSASDQDKKTENETNETKTAMVANDQYVEPLNPTEAQMKAYNKLSAALENQDLEEEARQVAVSFAYDFFTLSNKKSQSDMGGLAFIPTPYIGAFEEYATSYYYGNYPTIVNEYNKKSLPEVSDVQVISTKEAQGFMYLQQPVEGYEIELKVTYAETKVPVEKLKTSMTVTVIRIYDYDYDASIDYKKAYTQEGNPKEVYRVLAVE